ncbi:MFS transporter [Taylorella equigenitalis]|uniref:Transmembrane protein n=1 Tax=Taylorella equigenitalis (strain MCE9) TaxID=937774 RepID=A0A654KFB2_TAYEM|nr:hypothetical protein [Taylorella equigenitalis]ADU91114.1 hypothetical protein TEQUI_0158 [Taylorella equigenitalis MCE9]WDU55948.1 hypothetical protein KPH58_05620 [Taylorella equigenitalis]
MNTEFKFLPIDKPKLVSIEPNKPINSIQPRIQETQKSIPKEVLNSIPNEVQQPVFIESQIPVSIATKKPKPLRNQPVPNKVQNPTPIESNNSSYIETNKEMKKAIVQANKDLKRTEYGGILFIIYILTFGVVLGCSIWAGVEYIHQYISPHPRNIDYEIPKLIIFVLLGFYLSGIIFYIFPVLFALITFAIITGYGYLCFTYLTAWWAILLFIVGTLIIIGFHTESIYTYEFKEEMEIQ